MQNIYKETMRKIINKQAESLYDRLGVEPGFDIVNTVHKLGGEIEVDTGRCLSDHTEAEISPTEDNSNFRIVYTEDGIDPRYCRFSIAHELGHLFLHMAKKEDDGYKFVGDYKHQSNNDSIIEWEAEEFAAAFLMPERVFRLKVEEAEESSDNDNRDRIQWLADQFEVPYKSVITRGRSLNIW